MAQKKPSRPSGTKRAKNPSHVANPLKTPLDRAFAQKLRTDRPLTYESQTARASYWARQQRLLQEQQAQEMDQSVAEISQGTLVQSGTQFASANIQSATLQSAVPAVPGNETIAGMTAVGIVPPPPPH